MPNTIADNLARLQTARTDIANAITTKGGTVTSGDGFEDFPADIATIPSGGDIQFSHTACYITKSSSPPASNVMAVYNPSVCSISGAPTDSYSTTTLEVPIITTSSNVFICIPVRITMGNQTTASVSYIIPSNFPSKYGYNANTRTLYSYYKFEYLGTARCTVSASTFNFYVSNASANNLFGDFILKFDKT